MGKSFESMHMYCTTGIAASYITEQFCVWMFLHALFMFWGVVFPFNYRELKLNYLRHAHIISVVLGLVLPLPAALAPLKDGYVVMVHPTLACAGRNTDITYYTLVLPLSIPLALTSILLTLMFWTIFKVYCRIYLIKER